MLQTLIQTSKTYSSSESRSALKLSFVAGRELLGMRNKSHPEQSCSLRSDPKISGRDSSLVLRVVKRDNEHRFVDRAVVTVNTNRNYVLLGRMSLLVVACAPEAAAFDSATEQRLEGDERR